MSLFDRIVVPPTNLLDRISEAKAGQFTSCDGGALMRTDRSREGVRNKMSGAKFAGRNKRYPVDRGCWASTAGSLSQAHQRGVLKKKISGDAKSAFGVQPTALKGGPEKTDHGPGGKEIEPGTGGDHGGRWAWPFTHTKGGPKWDKDWSKLGHEKGSSGLPSQKGEPKRKQYKGTKGYHKAQKKETEKELAATKKGVQAVFGGQAKKAGKQTKKAAQAAERKHKTKQTAGGKLTGLKPELKGRHGRKVPSARGQ